MSRHLAPPPASVPAPARTGVSARITAARAPGERP